LNLQGPVNVGTLRGRPMTEAQEIDSEADRIDAKRSKAPGTSKIASLIFDARETTNDPIQKLNLETLAITVDGWAQSGYEASGITAAAIVEALLMAMGRRA